MSRECSSRFKAIATVDAASSAGCEVEEHGRRETHGHARKATGRQGLSELLEGGGREVEVELGAGRTPIDDADDDRLAAVRGAELATADPTSRRASRTSNRRNPNGWEERTYGLLFGLAVWPG